MPDRRNSHGRAITRCHVPCPVRMLDSIISGTITAIVMPGQREYSDRGRALVFDARRSVTNMSRYILHNARMRREFQVYILHSASRAYITRGRFGMEGGHAHECVSRPKSMPRGWWTLEHISRRLFIKLGAKHDRAHHCHLRRRRRTALWTGKSSKNGQQSISFRYGV